MDLHSEWCFFSIEMVCYDDTYQRDVQRDFVLETFPLRGVSHFDMLMEEIERAGSAALDVIFR